MCDSKDCEHYDINTNCCNIELDLTVYRLTAIKKAAYKFGGKYHIQINPALNNKIKLTFKKKSEKIDDSTLTGEFCNEVLDQELREIVAEETEVIRNLLLAQAFSNTSLIDELGDDGDYSSDPKNICNM